MMLRYLIYAIIFFSPLTALAQGPNTPLEFVKNEGQWDGAFEYKAQAGNVTLFVRKTGISYLLGDPLNVQKQFDYKHGKTATPPTLSFHRYNIEFVGANVSADITESKTQEHYYNYFLGNDSTKWKSNIHPHLALDYKDIYPSIDLHLASAYSSIKYDFIVNPGGDVSDIKLQVVGVDADKIRLKKGNIQINTSVGTVEEMAPFAYQYINGERVEVNCKYELDGNIITYKFPKGYDNSQILVVDPVVTFSTYSGSTADNWGFTATYDPQGNFYAGGAVDATNGAYLTTTGAFQTTYQGGGTGGGNGTSFRCDMAITKFNAAGSAMIYSTYIGGSDNDQPHSMIVDQSGNLIIAGRTYSNNFPTTGSAYDNTYNQNADIVVIKLNAAGSALIGSTYMGGSGDDGVNITSAYLTVNQSLKHSYGDEARSEVIIDNQDNIYVAASTRSSNFPTANPIKNTLTGLQDAVVFKLNSTLTTLLWSTYLGGNNDDAAYVLALNNSQSHLYVSGGTASSNFPFTSGAFWSSYQGGVADGFIAKFQNSGTYPLVAATAIGRNNYDQCYGIQVDADNNVYTMGQTLGGTFPVSTGVFSVPNSSQFVMKLDSNLSTNIFSTVFGSGNPNRANITPTAFSIDTCQNIYISGWGGDLIGGNPTNSSGMPIPASNPPTTPNNILKFTNVDSNDFYFIVLSRNAATQLYGAYYGLPGVFEHVDGGTSRFDKNGIIYQAICGGCGGVNNEPTTTGAWRNNNGSNNCNLIALKIAFNLGSVKAEASASPSTTICLGQPLTFLNTSSNALTYEWDFGDGSPVSTLNSPTHTYTTGGTFQVKLIARNPNVCRVIDSTTLTVTIDTNNINADFAVSIIDSCGPYTATFTNNSKFGNTPNTAVFTWYFGDGTTFTGTTPPTHTYPANGTYTIKLVMDDPNACNAPDSITRTITFAGSLVDADWEFPNIKCAQDTALFTNKSTNATSFFWDFGDGDTSTSVSPTHSYDSAGTYVVKFYAYNPTACNKVDSMQSSITIKDNPIADFTYAPIIPETNEPITFTNRSVGADLYNWNFGDGTGSQEKDPPPHLFKKTGSYTVCLTVTTNEGCTDIACKTIQADVYPLADIPNAFSPNGDGANDVLYVRGSGIEEMVLKIYNRWGEVIFESTDQDIGWDGTYKGKEQPMEAYAYVLDVTFIDETTLHKSGNVTLLR